jgi:hypothetical protein
LLRAKVKTGCWDSTAAETLLAILIYIPLEITQAAAYINCNHELSVKMYLEMLKKDHSTIADVLSEGLPDHRRQAGVTNAKEGPLNYSGRFERRPSRSQKAGWCNKCYLQNWKLSYEHILNSQTPHSIAATDILSLMAILDSQSNPATLLQEGIEIIPNERAAIQFLRDYCLIRDCDDRYSLHPLVQLSTQD